MIFSVLFSDETDTIDYHGPTLLLFLGGLKKYFYLTFFEVSIVEEVVIFKYNLFGTRTQGPSELGLLSWHYQDREYTTQSALHQEAPRVHLYMSSWAPTSAPSIPRPLWQL